MARYLTETDHAVFQRMKAAFQQAQRPELAFGAAARPYPTIVQVPSGGLAKGDAADCRMTMGPSLGDLSPSTAEIRVHNVVYDFIAGGELALVEWTVVDETGGGWVVVAWRGLRILGGIAKADIQPDASGPADLYEAAAGDDSVLLESSASVSLDWAHDGLKIDTGKQLIVADRGVDKLIIGAECPDSAAPVGGAPTLLDLAPRSVLFNSSGPDYVAGPVVTGNSLAVRFKVYTTASPGAAQTIFDARDGASDGLRVLINTSGEFSANVNGGTAVTTTTWTHNTWGEIEVTYDGATLSIEHVGQTPVTNAETGTIAVTTNCRMGCNSFNTSNAFDGYVAYCEVDSGGSPQFSWHFRERSGTTVFDESGEGNSGTLTAGDEAAFWMGGKIGTTDDITWTSDGDEWDVYFGTHPDGYIFRETVTTASWDPGTLSAATEYAFKVVAKTSVGETAGPYMVFKTA